MIDSVSGEVVRRTADAVVIDTGGVAYRAACPAGTLRACEIGRTALLYIHLILREDTIELFGFSSLRERELFRQLLTVAQVGPRVALQILSSIPPDKLVEAVASRNADLLMTVKGVGRKTAERILVDLHGKLAEAGDGGTEGLFLTPNEETALRALTSKSLGFSAREAREALTHLRGENLDVEILIRRALETLGSRS
ncbi:MAG: Holliday junction branch migration protein RuvA [Candidatus Bipolaricaulota bacterium]|nr:Holliday junction branch migration protein RuvA [Candidatus Bipolaricaulota bacterium]